MTITCGHCQLCMPTLNNYTFLFSSSSSSSSIVISSISRVQHDLDELRLKCGQMEASLAAMGAELQHLRAQNDMKRAIDNVGLSLSRLSLSSPSRLSALSLFSVSLLFLTKFLFPPSLSLSTYLGCQAVVPMVAALWGCVLSVASVLIVRPEWQLIIYPNSTIEFEDHTFSSRTLFSGLQAAGLSPRRRKLSSNRSQFLTRLSSSPVPSQSHSTDTVEQAREVVGFPPSLSLSLCYNRSLSM